MAKSPRQGRDWLLPILLITFVAGLFPFAADYVLFHPDERHYVDAGMGMLRSGDFLTPRHANGDLRLKKPLLPYWVAAAGFWAVGVSPLGGRIGFLLAGAAVVWLTWKTARLASGWQAHSVCRLQPDPSRIAALLAAAIAACHPALLISAPRSVPDVCLALGVAISQWGFVGILAHGTMRRRWIAAAFGGGAIAVLSKGLPGGVFLAFATAFLIWRKPSLALRHWRALVIAALISSAVSGSWFAFIAAQHQDELARQFVNDQIGSHRFVESGWQAAAHFPAYVLIVAATLLPWLSAAWRSRQKTGTKEYTESRQGDEDQVAELARVRSHRRVSARSLATSATERTTDSPNIAQTQSSSFSFRDLRVFRGSAALRGLCRLPHVQMLLGWTLLYCGLASFVNHVSPRYLLPVVPALGIIVGDLLSRMDADSLRRGLRRLLITSAMTTIAAASIGLLLAWSISAERDSHAAAIALCIVLALCGSALLFLRRGMGRWGRAGQAAGVAFCVHAMLGIAGFTLHAALPDSFAEQVHAELNATGLSHGRVIVIGAPAHATRLRVELDGQFEVVWVGDTSLPRDLQPSDIIVVDERIAEPSQLSNYDSRAVTCGYRDYGASDLVAALFAGRLRDFLSQQQKHYVVATRSTTKEIRGEIQQAGWEQP